MSISFIQGECNPETCTQMTATEQWIFLCAAHKTPKEVGKLIHVMRKPVYAICEQQRPRSACASAQSVQHLYCSLLRQYNIYTSYIQNLKTLASFCNWAGRFESCLVATPKTGFLMMCSIDTSWENLPLEVYDQVRLKPACSAEETNKIKSLGMLGIATIGIILSRQRIKKMLIRLCWSASLLFAYGINRFSHEMTQLSRDMTKTTKWSSLVSLFLSAWRNLGSLDTHWAHSEDSDQTGRMPRLIWSSLGAQPLCWFCHAVAHFWIPRTNTSRKKSARILRTLSVKSVIYIEETSKTLIQ